MKSNKNKLSELFRRVQESNDDKLEGGFSFINSTGNSQIIALGGQNDPTNNCNSGNCVAGCQSNNVPGCGANTNTTTHCGVSTNNYAGCTG